jgi:hypothetical protein
VGDAIPTLREPRTAILRDFIVISVYCRKIDGLQTSLKPWRWTEGGLMVVMF